MKTYSAYNDDGITVIVVADSEEQAIEKTADKIAEIGFEFDLGFFEDDLDGSFVTDDETVSDWLKSHGVKFNESNMLVMEMNDVEQHVEVYQL